jgi:probable F420-dependent oxidoreductase
VTQDRSSRPAVGFAAGDAATARALEKLGVDSLWTSGHLSIGRPVTEPISRLGVLAGATERVLIGTAVAVLPLYHPVVVAKQIAEVDVSSGGRVIFGVGVGGEYPGEFDAVAVPVRERAARTDEAIPLLKDLWRGGPVDHSGRFWQLRGTSVSPPPVHLGVPVVVGGRKEPAMRRAALLGDGSLPFLYSPERYARSVVTITEIARAAGRSLDGFEWMVWVYVSVDVDPGVARSTAARSIGAVQAGDASRFGPLVDRVAAVGTPAQVTARLQGFVDAGARHLILVPVGNRGESARRQLLDEIVPALRLPGNAT